MIPLDRKKQILDMMKAEKFCTVSEISQKLYVSQMTVRRDLIQLEKEGYITRCRGGAEYVDVEKTQNLDFHVSLRKEYNSERKKTIAKEAVKRIERGDTIFLDYSSTVEYMTEFLPQNFGITVITNSIEITKILSGKDIDVICLGGSYFEQEKALFGYVPESNANSMKIDKLFFSARGIVPGDGIYDSSYLTLSIRKSMISKASKSYFLCGSDKIGKKFMFRICSVNVPYEIICDKNTDFLTDSVKESDGLNNGTV